MVDKKVVEKVIGDYASAWINRDPEAIIKIFTKDGEYHERVLGKPFIGHNEIKQYWKDKVIGEQEDIKFKLLALYIDGDTAIAEWEATFHDCKMKYDTHMKEVAVLEFKGDKIKSLREYWSSEHY